MIQSFSSQDEHQAMMTEEPMSLTLSEKVFIIKNFYRMNEDVSSVSLAYKKQFLVEVYSVRNLIPRLVNLFESTGWYTDLFSQSASI